MSIQTLIQKYEEELPKRWTREGKEICRTKTRIDSNTIYFAPKPEMVNEGKECVYAMWARHAAVWASVGCGLGLWVKQVRGEL